MFSKDFLEKVKFKVKTFADLRKILTLELFFGNDYYLVSNPLQIKDIDKIEYVVYISDEKIYLVVNN